MRYRDVLVFCVKSGQGAYPDCATHYLKDSVIHVSGDRLLGRSDSRSSKSRLDARPLSAHFAPRFVPFTPPPARFIASRWRAAPGPRKVPPSPTADGLPPNTIMTMSPVIAIHLSACLVASGFTLLPGRYLHGVVLALL